MPKKLAARDPNDAEWQRDLSLSYDRIGDINAARATATARSRPILTAWRFKRSSPRAIPQRRMAARSLDQLRPYRRYRAARGDREARSRPMRTAWRFRKKLAARDPNNAEWQRDLSLSYDNIGDINAARGDRDAALKAYANGLEIQKKARRTRSQQRRMAARSLPQL